MSKPPTISAARKRRFQEKLLGWYKESARDLPWRKTHNPYHILVSEIMLQQTQVDRVIEKYTQWLKLFPTVEALARAPQKKVVAAWQGLGYNRRALYLHKAAQYIVNELGGVFPRTNDGLQQLPGVGPYTAGAVASFAFKQEAAILDTNVKRVVGRVFLGYKKLACTNESTLWELSSSLLPRGKRAYDFNQAIMDFGAMVCIQRKPKCDVCPFQRMCDSYPAIQEAQRSELQLPKVKETLYFGKPRRIWRGKILQYLHSCTEQSATFTEIGTHIKNDYNREQQQWLESVVHSLEKDGLVKTKASRATLV